MSQWDKLLSRLTTLDEGLRFEKLKKILEAYGYRINDSRSGGGHYVFRKEGEAPHHGPAAWKDKARLHQDGARCGRRRGEGRWLRLWRSI